MRVEIAQINMGGNLARPNLGPNPPSIQWGQISLTLARSNLSRNLGTLEITVNPDLEGCTMGLSTLVQVRPMVQLDHLYLNPILVRLKSPKCLFCHCFAHIIALPIRLKWFKHEKTGNKVTQYLRRNTEKGSCAWPPVR